VDLKVAVTGLIPFDATPDNTADNVYVVGLDVDSNPVISQAKLDGSATPKALHTGDPLVSPLNIAVGTDGMMLYVADPGAEDPAGKLGRIFSIANDGGALGNVTGADGYRARGLEIISVDGKDIIYFAGTDPAGEAGVFKVPADNSGSLEVVAKGAPFQDPSGIAVTAKGDVYVCDTVQDSDGLGIVVAIKSGAVSTLLTGVRAGFPCGIALSLEDSSLVISAFDPIKKTDTVINYDLASNTSTMFSEGIDTFIESAGLHRAKQGGNTFAWSDSIANGGTVFRITMP
jgi:DNA-binding beta-propeller fold protein YncE